MVKGNLLGIVNDSNTGCVLHELVKQFNSAKKQSPSKHHGIGPVQALYRLVPLVPFNGIGPVPVLYCLVQ